MIESTILNPPFAQCLMEPTKLEMTCAVVNAWIGGGAISPQFLHPVTWRLCGLKLTATAVGTGEGGGISRAYAFLPIGANFRNGHPSKLLMLCPREQLNDGVQCGHALHVASLALNVVWSTAATYCLQRLWFSASESSTLITSSTRDVSKRWRFSQL